ncbi:PP2C family protein-serine/threonine phosphatase [Streptomyces sp. NBC_00838]|uniref:PP2C family protein-serine/threonine phosphatase n=1 Tax=Streptomyces sp. NBC_00838 TaxID=2903680 RepID=UPI003863DDEF|nr:PP2C family protein-serine/threonine phosphatase [Streptomyces sp. NBC_00838]
MDERHSRIQQYPWLAPVLLAGAAGLELLTPEIVNGAALVAVAGMVAAITSTFRNTLLIVTIGLAIIVVAAVLSGFTDFEKGVQIAEVLIAGALALAVRRMLDRQSVSFSLVRSTVEILQRAVLPPLPTIVGPMVVACRYEAASTEARIGGDLYAVEETPFGLRLLIADVRGRGLGAVSSVSVIVGAFRERAQSERDLAGLAERLDRAVARSLAQYADPFAAEAADAAEAFATALLVEIDRPGTTMRVLSCGHPAPYLVRDGELCQLDTGEATPPLGMLDLAPGTGGPRSCDFPTGTTLLCVTDGVTEARNAAGTFYDPCQELRPAPDGDPERLIDALFASVSRWVEGERDDDMAVVAVSSVDVDGRESAP